MFTKIILFIMCSVSNVVWASELSEVVVMEEIPKIKIEKTQSFDSKRVYAHYLRQIQNKHPELDQNQQREMATDYFKLYQQKNP